jgi:hypothetical protein
MKKNPVFLLFFLGSLGVFGCDSKKAWEPGYLASLESKRTPANFLNFNSSRLKSRAQGQCFEDTLNQRDLTLKIQDLLDKKQEESGQGLNLDPETPETWHPVEADLANEFREMIHPKPFESDCTNLPCLYRKAYGRPEGDLSDLLSTYWLLKTGWPIRVVGPQPNSWVLFPEKELKALAKIASILPSRVRDLQSMDFLVAGAVPPGFAGEARTRTFLIYPNGRKMFQSKKTGHIVIRPGSDHGFMGDDFFEQSEDFFYHLWTHEIAHHVDFSQMSEPEYYLRFSELEEWLSIGGWVQVERSDPETNEVREVWAHDIQKEPLLVFNENSRDPLPYAATSPQEDFAEHFAFYRWAPEKFSPDSKKYDFLKSRVFEGREFSVDSVIQNMAQEIFDSLIIGLHAEGHACFNGEPLSEDKAHGESFLKGSFELVNHPLVPCFVSLLGKLYVNIINEIRYKSWSGCAFTQGELRETLDQAVSTQLRDSLSTQIESLSRQVETQSLMNQINDQLSERIDPSEVFLNCQKVRESSKCYQIRIRKAFSDISSDFPSLPKEVKRAIQTEFLQDYRYSNADRITRDRYWALLPGLELALKKSSSEDLIRCEGSFESTPFLKDSGSGLKQVSMGSFEVPGLYLHPKMSQCLYESKMSLDVNKIIRSLDTTYVYDKDPHSEFLEGLLKSKWHEFLQSLIEEKSSIAKEKLQESQKSLTHQIAMSMIEESDWLEGSQGGSSYQQCKRSASNKISSDSSWEQEIPRWVWGYKSFNGFKEQCSRRICNQVSEDSNYSTLLKGSAFEKQELLLKELKGLLEVEYKKVEKAECDGFISSLIEKISDSCALAHSHTIVTSAYEKWRELPITKGFFQKPSQAWQWVTTHAYDLLRTLDEEKGQE